MKKSFILLMTAVLSFAFSSCNDDPVAPPYPEISIDKELLNVGYDIDTDEITITTNREWSIVSDVDWLAFDPSEGGAVGETADYKVTVTSLKNTVGNMRKANVTFRTRAVYQMLSVVQAPNPNEAPSDLYSINFGKKLDGDNPYVGKSSCWWGGNYEAGAAFEASTRKFYASSEKVTIRNSSSSNSTGYAGASGDNHMHFGSNTPSFVVCFTEMHSAVRSVSLSFGILRNEYGDVANAVKVEEFPVWASIDGQKWTPVNYSTVGAPQDKKWSLCKGTFSFSEAIDALYLRFCPTVSSTYRFDDLVVTCSKNVGDNPVDWTAGTAFELGTEVELK